VADIILAASTGSAIADHIMCAIIGLFDLAFPGRLRSCYIDGSYADGTETARSDIDVTIVFKDRFADDAERDRAVRLAGYSAALSSLELDVEVTDDAQVAVGVYPSLKGASLCLYGEDQRAQWSILPMDTWTRGHVDARAHACGLLAPCDGLPPSSSCRPSPRIPRSGGPFFRVCAPDGASAHRCRRPFDT